MQLLLLGQKQCEATAKLDLKPVLDNFIMYVCLITNIKDTGNKNPTNVFYLNSQLPLNQ